jgi:glutaminyl-peptide cyclotransferase
MQIRRLLPVMMLLTISLASCAGIESQPTATTMPTVTVTHTVSPAPTLVPSPTLATTEQATVVATVEFLGPEIVAKYPHNIGAYTEGLVWFDGKLYESTGNYPSSVLSTLRELDLASGAVLRSIELALPIYAEGLALVDDRLIQITWKDQVAYVYDRESFEQIQTLDYTGEGWGLCYDGSELYMSDGSSTITVRDAMTFEPLRTLSVTTNGGAINNLNELECVGDVIYANVWKTDQILRIDKQSGIVTGIVFAGDLLAPGEATDHEAVLNGIAYNPESETFYITGKLWPWLFEVRFEAIP